MRKKEKLWVAGNWKMNLDLNEAEAFYASFTREYNQHPHVEVLIAPAYTHLYRLVYLFQDTGVEIMAQNMHWADKGAYTGEVSAAMLRSVGVRRVILGHSERRQYFGETDEILRKKVSRVIEDNMRTIFCVGEKLEDREAGRHFDTVRRQVEKALFSLHPEDWAEIMIAYEPVWAIGTGRTASPQQADEMHRYIREVIAAKYGTALAQNLPILYGGSVKPANARDIFAMENVDGGLVGGASLVPEDFLKIIEAATSFFD